VLYSYFLDLTGIQRKTDATLPRYMPEDSFQAALQNRILMYAQAEQQAEARLSEVQSEVERLRQRREASETLFEAEFGSKPPPGAADASTPGLFTDSELGQMQGPLSGMRWEQAIEAVLRDADAPMHVRDIWDRLAAGGFRTTARDPLRSIVTISLRSPNIHHVGPRTFGLAARLDVDPKEA
jgi:hypothetical protein